MRSKSEQMRYVYNIISAIRYLKITNKLGNTTKCS